MLSPLGSAVTITPVVLSMYLWVHISNQDRDWGSCRCLFQLKGSGVNSCTAFKSWTVQEIFGIRLPKCSCVSLFRTWRASSSQICASLMRGDPTKKATYISIPPPLRYSFRTKQNKQATLIKPEGAKVPRTELPGLNGFAGW